MHIKQLKISYILLGFFFAIFIASACSKGQNFDCAKQCRLVPEKDLRKIEILFDDFIKRYQFGYTIFGDKPVSIMGYYSVTPFGNLNSNTANHTKKRWELWKQYQHLFPMHHYLLFDEPTPSHDLRVITLVNIELFVHTFNQHLTLFQKKLGENMTADELIHQLSHPETQGLFNILKQDEKLYGILLGYGKKSASLYKRFFKIESYLNPLYEKTFSIKALKISKGFESLNDELIFLRSQFIEPNPDHILSFIRSVHFMAAKDDPEAELLIKKYRANKKELAKIYKDKSPMLISLEKLCAP